MGPWETVMLCTWTYSFTNAFEMAGAASKFTYKKQLPQVSNKF